MIARCLIDDLFGQNRDSVKIMRIRRDLARGRREESLKISFFFFSRRRLREIIASLDKHALLPGTYVIRNFFVQVEETVRRTKYLREEERESTLQSRFMSALPRSSACFCHSLT